MKKDLSSFIAHDNQYVVNDVEVENTLQIIKKYDDDKVFENQGFDRALGLFPNRNLHIDIGSGTGWLLRKTSPLFEKVIGIEPSKAATNVSSRILKDNQNIEYINEDMVDAILKMQLKSPAFFTTSIVLSHIKDFHVSNLLEVLNSAPEGSTLYFYENYDTPISHRHWYIRNRNWWSSQLPNWDLSFFDIQNDIYKSGIFGKCVGAQNVKSFYRMTLVQNISWIMRKYTNNAIKILNKLFKLKIKLR